MDTHAELFKLSVANSDRQKEWDPGNKIDLNFRGVELAGEVGELCNIIKKMTRERLGLRGSRATIDDAKEEIGDVAICLGLICNDLGIDMWEAIKFSFNRVSEKHDLKTRL